MLSRDVTAYPDGSGMALPGYPAVISPHDPAGEAGPLPASRWQGRPHELALTGPCGAGDLGYMGRDPTDPAGTVPESGGMFARLHAEAGGKR